MGYAIYIAVNTKDLTHNRPYDACLLKPAIKFTRANNSDLLRVVETINGNQASKIKMTVYM